MMGHGRAGCAAGSVAYLIGRPHVNLFTSIQSAVVSHYTSVAPSQPPRAASAQWIGAITWVVQVGDEG
jgi:hypothetical protein